MWGSENILSKQMAGVVVSLSIWYDLEWPGKRVSLRDCLDQVDLWACLWGLVLTLNDVEKLSLLGWRHSLGLGPGWCKGERHELSGKHAFIPFCS